MDMIQLYRDYNVSFLTEGHKHCSKGWINTPCPFCTGNPGYHLGTPLNGDIYKCRRCGLHFPDETLAKLLNITRKEAKVILEEYGGISVKAEEPVIKIKKKSFKYPSGIIPLTNKHKRYLEGRGFDPELLEQKWDLKSTGIRSMLDEINYSYRILAPIYWEGEEVSFQTRQTKTITHKKDLKYMACTKEREIIHHKHLVYGMQYCKRDVGLGVEGITDVWRFGNDTVGVFGIEYKRQQVRIISKRFKKFIVIFDDEPQAQEKAKELVADLRFRGVEARNEVIMGDPGGMKQEDANYLKKQLLK